MKYIQKFESLSGGKTYVEITEHCGYEGEDWTTYLIEQGNEEFISKLEEAIKKYSDLEGSDMYLTIDDRNVTENEVDVVIRRMKNKGGYMDPYKKIDKVINLNKIDDSDEDAFVNCFYKGRLLRK